jgi:hypothetical protein
MSAPWSLSGAKRTLGKLYSTSVSHNYAASQLPYPRTDCLPRSGLVQEMLTGAGASPGTPNGWRHPSPPSAGQWADPSYKIPGWRVLGPGESPQPGDVAAQPGNYSDATGHVIVGPNNTFMGVGQSTDPEKIESIPKKDNIVTLPAKGPLLYRRFVGQ